jgi:hypothetical protein
MSDMKNEEPRSSSPRIPQSPHHFPIAPILGVLLIMVVLCLGGLYIWGSLLSKDAETPMPLPINNEPETPRAVVDTQILETTSPSDDLSAIEADLNSTNFDSLDTDLITIDTEMETSLPQ